MTDLVKRLRDWPCIYPEDLYEPEGYLYEVAADRIEALEAEVKALTTAGIVEVAVRNPNVREYMRHWEGRAEKAEAERDALREAIAQWVAAREAAMSDVSPVTFTELSKAESALARTNKEKSDAPQQQTA